MNKIRKPCPTESPLLFDIDPETVTALGGDPMFVQRWRSLGLPWMVREQVRAKERERGYGEATMVESFLIVERRGR